MATVLVIEDNPANMKLAVLLLEGEGHEVLQARDALAGLALARERQPALILMDIQLPGMNGLDATRVLKGDPRTASIGIIALTAFAMSGDDQRVIEAGCDGYLTKPIRYRELLDVVARALEATHVRGAPITGPGTPERSL